MARIRTHTKAPVILPLISLLLAFCVCSCTEKRGKEEKDSTKANNKSNAGILLDGITGKSAIERGKKQQDTIRDISKEQDKNLNQAMDL